MIERLLEAERALAVGLHDQAERIYQQAVDADPRNSIAVVGLARVALERGDETRAYAMGLRALEIDSDNQAARRLVDRLVEVRAARGEAPPKITETRGATAVAIAPPAPARASAPATAPPTLPAAKPKAAGAPAPVARPTAPLPPLHSRTRDALVEMPQPTSPVKPVAAAERSVAPMAAAPKPAAPTSDKRVAAEAPAKQVTPAREKAAAEAPATVRPEPKAPAASAPPKSAPEAPGSAARAAASAAPRKSKVTQPVKIRTAGSRRSGQSAVAPPTTALPKAKPLMPSTEPPKPADDLALEIQAEAPPRAARSATRGASPPPARKMRRVEPKQPGLFDRLFRPRR